MQEISQKTLSNNVSFHGVGLHSGQKSTINILPAAEDHGIVFKRIDLKKIILLKRILQTCPQQNYAPLWKIILG